MDNEGLVRYLIESRQVILSDSVRDAFLKVDRKDFVPKSYHHDAYEDTPLPIGLGQTISQPTTVAFMLELLSAQHAHQVLDVGSGSGYTSALLSSIVGPRGQVTGVERLEKLAAFGQKNLSSYPFPWASIEAGCASTQNYPKSGFDRILVSAAASLFPEYFLSALKVGGILVIPIGEEIVKLTRTDSERVSLLKYPGFSFVPLVTS